MRIILGSSSPWRREVMEALGLDFEVMHPDVDEQAIRRKDPFALTMALAWAKNRALRPRVEDSAVIITADQVTVYEGQIREKPADADQARTFLRSYRSGFLSAFNAVCVHNTQTGKTVSGTNTFDMSFKNLTDEAIEELIAGDVAMTCAGASGVGHPEFEPYVAFLIGTWEDCYGLPRKLTTRLLRRAWPDFPQSSA